MRYLVGDMVEFKMGGETVSGVILSKNAGVVKIKHGDDVFHFFEHELIGKAKEAPK
jgi:hypothetical protein